MILDGPKHGTVNISDFDSDAMPKFHFGHLGCEKVMILMRGSQSLSANDNVSGICRR